MVKRTSIIEHGNDAKAAFLLYLFLYFGNPAPVTNILKLLHLQFLLYFCCFTDVSMVFKKPKVNIVALLQTCTSYVASPVASVLASLWIEFVHKHCKEFSYEASMAGLHCDFQNTRAGIEIHVSGYNHKADRDNVRYDDAGNIRPVASLDNPTSTLCTPQICVVFPPSSLHLKP